VTTQPKRAKKQSHLLSLLATLVATGLMLSLGGPRGAAVNSPAEDPLLVQPPSIEESTVPDAAETSPEVTAATEEVIPVWNGPIQKSDPVVDTYFADAVFLGNSRTDGLRLYGGMEYGTFLCATGITVESAFTKSIQTDWGNQPLLDTLSTMDVGKIYIMLGVNELGWSGTEIFQQQSAKLLERLLADHPDAQIVIQSILPVSAHQESKGTYVNNERIADYNAVWQTLAQEYDIPYLDVSEAVVGSDGFLLSDLTFDGIHLNTKGCKLWVDYLYTHPAPEPLPEQPA